MRMRAVLPEFLRIGLALALALVTCVASQANGEERMPRRAITLRDTVAEALRYNPSIAASVAEVSIARARQREAVGAEDFVLGSTVSWAAARGPSVAALLQDDALANLSLARPLPTGGRVSLNAGGEYTAARPDASGLAARAFVPAVTLSLSHPLLRGMGVAVARAGRRRAQSALDEMALQHLLVVTEFVRTLTQTYWELAFAAEQLKVRQASAARAREQLAAVKANIDAGKQPPSASAEVEVAIALREDDLLQADLYAQDRSVDLKALVGLDRSPHLDPEPWEAADALEPELIGPDLSIAIERAREHNPRVGLARALGRSAGIEVDVTNNGLLPQLDAWINVGSRVANAEPLVALRGLARFDGYLVQGGLTLSFPIERNVALGRAAAAREGVRKARLNEESIGLQVASAVLRSMQGLASARQRVGVLVHAVEVATLDLDAEKARFHAGRSSNFDVLRRQDELARAQLQRARAKADYLRNAAELAALTGDVPSMIGSSLGVGE